MSNSFNAQRGNALFLILIAVALFAALSYAVTQSGRGGGTIDKEQNILSGAQLTQHAAGIETAVQRMMLTGTAFADLDFTHDGSQAGDDAVFAPEGGGAEWRSAAELGLTFNVVMWGPTVNVAGVGTAAGEQTLAMQGMALALCEQINKGLGLANPPVLDAGAFTVGAYPGEPYACYNFATINYIYYHVLAAQ